MMRKNIHECLERAAECARLAERVDDAELKLYLTKLATSWTKVAAEIIDAQSHDTIFVRSSGVSGVDRYCPETIEVSATILQMP